MRIKYTGDVKRDLYHEGRAFSLSPNDEFDAETCPELPDFEEVSKKPSKPPSEANTSEGNDA